MSTNKQMLKSAFYAGLIMLGIFVLLDILIYSFDLSSYRILTGIVSLAVTISVFIYLGRKYRNEYFNGYISYGRSFAFILIAVLVYAVFYSIYTFLFYEYFDPSRLEELVKVQLNQMQAWGFDEDLIMENENEIRAKISAQSTALWSFVGVIFMGVFFGAISALFIRKKEKISEVF